MIDFVRMRELIREAPRRCYAVEAARARAYGSGVRLTGMPGGSSSGDKLERDAITIMEVEVAYLETLKELRVMQAELRPMIDRLEDAGERAVMRLRYLDGYSPDRIASSELVPMARMTVYRHLRRAEENIRRMQVGIE